MTDKNINEAQMALFDYFVDTLVDLSDPADDDLETIRDDMMQVVTIMFEGAGITAVSSQDGVVTFTARF